MNPHVLCNAALYIAAAILADIGHVPHLADTVHSIAAVYSVILLAYAWYDS